MSQQIQVGNSYGQTFTYVHAWKLGTKISTRFPLLEERKIKVTVRLIELLINYQM